MYLNKYLIILELRPLEREKAIGFKILFNQEHSSLITIHSRPKLSNLQKRHILILDDVFFFVFWKNEITSWLFLIFCLEQYERTWRNCFLEILLFFSNNLLERKWKRNDHRKASITLWSDIFNFLFQKSKIKSHSKHKIKQ